MARHLRPELILHDIPKKANRVLQLFLIICILLALRVGHLTLKCHEKALQEAFLGRKRTEFENAPRGTIRDCQNVLLATNTTEYEVRVLWSQFQQITNRKLRKQYVKVLSKRLSKILQNDPQDIEDTLYSFAALNPHIPYVLQKGISEEQYHSISALEHLYPGLEAAKSYRRLYPKAKVGCHILGYTAAIDSNEYNRLLLKRHELQKQLQATESGADAEPVDYAQTKYMLDKLTRQAYSILDRVGKTGVEASYEESLRGKRGSAKFFANAQGAYIRQLSGALSTLPGDRLVLTVSSELQEHCENLLAESDVERRQLFAEDIISQKPNVMNPFQRGGAIIAVEPSTGAIRALASFPRFDSNDFSPKANRTPKELYQWLAQPSFIENLWNQKTPYYHEKYNQKTKEIETEEIFLEWKDFLTLTLPKDSPIRTLLPQEKPVLDCIKVQQALYRLSDIYNYPPDEMLFYLYQETIPQDIASQINLPNVKPHKQLLDSYMSKLSTHDERILLIDLMRLIIRVEELQPSDIEYLKKMSIHDFRTQVCSCVQQYDECKLEGFKAFWTGPFRVWRKDHEVSFLKQIRLQEKQTKKRAEPYLTILKREAKHQFEKLWHDHWEEWFSQVAHLNADTSLIPLFVRSGQLDFFLLGRYQFLTRYNNDQTGLSLLSSLQTVLLPAASSFAFQNLSPPGSIFKLVVAYAALLQRDHECKGQYSHKDVDFFQIIDKTYKIGTKRYVGQFLDGKPIPQLYKGGRIPKSSHADFGHLNLSKAISVSSNPYFSLLASEYLETPSALEQTANLLGYGVKTGIDLPAEGRGNFPTDLDTNKTGLYTTAIGQHTLLSTPLQTAMMLSTIANGGKVIAPKVVQKTIAIDSRAEESQNLPMADSIKLLGLTPNFFIETELNNTRIQIDNKPELIKREIHLPDEVRKCILKSMQSTVHRLTADVHTTYRRKLLAHPDWAKALETLTPHLVGKTSTAEVQTRFGLNNSNSFLYNHIWFGGIYFADTNLIRFESPELVVVIFLKYGSYGKETLPMATSVIQKWLDIKKNKL